MHIEVMQRLKQSLQYANETGDINFAVASWLQIMEITLTTFCIGRCQENREEFLKDILVQLAKNVKKTLVRVENQIDSI